MGLKGSGKRIKVKRVTQAERPVINKNVCLLGMFIVLLGKLQHRIKYLKDRYYEYYKRKSNIQLLQELYEGASELCTIYVRNVSSATSFSGKVTFSVND